MLLAIMWSIFSIFYSTDVDKCHILLFTSDSGVTRRADALGFQAHRRKNFKLKINSFEI